MNTQNELIAQAIAQCQSIASAMQAADPDSWEKLEALHDEGDKTPEQIEELQELGDALSGFDDADDAEQRIYELPLSVEVRSGWHTPGEESTPGEFRVVLCTGGPHVELLGELDHNGEPCRVWVAARDWGQYIDDVSECRDYAGTLLAFAQRLIAA